MSKYEIKASEPFVMVSNQLVEAIAIEQLGRKLTQDEEMTLARSITTEYRTLVDTINANIKMLFKKKANFQGWCICGKSHVPTKKCRAALERFENRKSR